MGRIQTNTNVKYFRSFDYGEWWFQPWWLESEPWLILIKLVWIDASYWLREIEKNKRLGHMYTI